MTWSHAPRPTESTDGTSPCLGSLGAPEPLARSSQRSHGRGTAALGLHIKDGARRKSPFTAPGQRWPHRHPTHRQVRSSLGPPRRPQPPGPCAALAFIVY